MPPSLFSTRRHQPVISLGTAAAELEMMLVQIAARGLGWL